MLKLERGGELRICPKTNLSLSADPGGKALVLGLNEGSMELDYALHSAADTLITPDFRVQLISPGTFHFAISVAPTGDTCVRSLAGNDAALFIAEMMGSGLLPALAGKERDVPGGKDLRGDGRAGGLRLSGAEASDDIGDGDASGSGSGDAKLQFGERRRVRSSQTRPRKTEADCRAQARARARRTWR